MADISKITILDGTTYNLKDANVPSWARQANKPSYTASELGLGTSNLKFNVRDADVSPASQVFGLNGIVQATNNPRKGHSISLAVRNDVLTLWDFADSSAIWNIYPIKVKGDAESTYRTGNVNLTTKNIGAAPFIEITANDTSKESIFSKLSKLTAIEVGTIKIAEPIIATLTGKNNISKTVYGTVLRNTSSKFYFDLAEIDGANRFVFSATITSTAIQPGKVYKYTGTVES